MKNILVYEPFADPGRLSQLVFLLNLADNYCFKARNPCQALNWIYLFEQHSIVCDLVLISSLEGKVSEQPLLEKIAQLDIPILFIQRGTTMPEPLRDKAIACEPADLFNHL